MASNLSVPALTRRQQIAAVALAALVVGAALAPYAAGVASGPDGTVAVVAIEGSIGASLAEEVETELRAVREDESIDAVVLRIDSPGGAPAASERIYTSVQATAAEKPVVASVQGYGASGAYYALLPADRVYALPTSVVGSVGVAGSAPEPSAPAEGTSGPDKRGGNVIQERAEQDALADVFLSTVMAQRGDELPLSREEVAHADTYLGVEAVDNGFADEIGDVEAAIDDAAERAGLDSYEVQQRDTSTNQGIVLLSTDDGIVAVQGEDPGYGDVSTPQYLMVYEPALPEFESVQAVVEGEDVTADGTGGDPAESDGVRSEGEDAPNESGAAPDADDDSTGGDGR